MIDLIGHVINKYEFNKKDETLSLTVDNDKVFLIKVEGDCCSTGKFIGVGDDYDLCLPQRVSKVEKSSGEFSVGSDSYVVYEETLVFENGKKLNIVYDNYSNGYYGSSLDTYYDGKRLWEFPKNVPSA